MTTMDCERGCGTFITLATDFLKVHTIIYPKNQATIADRDWNYVLYIQQSAQFELQKLHELLHY